MINLVTYIELHCHSYFSLLDGASSPEALIGRAAQLGMTALALTDHDAIYGAVRFSQAAQEIGIRPIFGTELTLDNGQHLTLLVENAAGWQNLCTLISAARHNAPKGRAALPAHLLADHSAGLIALSGCGQGAAMTALRRGDWQEAARAVHKLIDLFGRDQTFIELQQHRLPEDDELIYKAVVLARQVGVQTVATNNVHYATRTEHRLQDVLVCIRHNQTIESAETICRPNSEYFLKSAEEMGALFAAYPEAIQNTAIIADRCQFELHGGLQDLPVFPTPDGLSAEAYLMQLCEAAISTRPSTDSDAARTLLRHELDLIGRVGLANYFLIVWEIVEFSRANGIRCQGRGSSANSLVAYLLGISPINPLVHKLVFERFLSEERRATPDIDIDFQANRREEVIQHIYARYGTTHAAMACTLVTFRKRSAHREVAKALGLPLDISAKQPAIDSALHQQWERLSRQIMGIPRHLGIHNGGMIIMNSLLTTRLPTEPATMADRVVVQWDKESLEDSGLVKIDILGLRMLSAVAETLDLIAHMIPSPPAPLPQAGEGRSASDSPSRTTWDRGVGGEGVDLDALNFADPAVYELICQANTVGVFQVESRAQAQVLPRLQPRRFADLIVAISLIRPGPVQGNMVHPYLRRRTGQEAVTYPHPLLSDALGETLGVVLFQEQVLKVARDLGGLTPGQGELLRRTLGKHNRQAELAIFEALFTAGARRNGASDAVAMKVFDQLRAFGGYSFPKSHAAAFAVLVYQSAWLKCYYPAAFFCALLNNQPMGFWSPAVLVNDARRHGVPTLPIDSRYSDVHCTLDRNAIRLGLTYVKGLGETAAAQLVEARAERSFGDLADFCHRTQLSRLLIERLILVGAFDYWHIPRRELLWQLAEVSDADGSLDLKVSTPPFTLPPLSAADRLSAEYAILGLSVGDHVMGLYRAQLIEQRILDSRELAQQKVKSMVRVAGQSVMHQAPPTAKGHHFLTLEDEWGMINVILRPAIYAAYAKVIREAPILVVEGEVQRQGPVINLIAIAVTAV